MAGQEAVMAMMHIGCHLSHQQEASSGSWATKPAVKKLTVLLTTL